jgi:hypothetical protein
VLGPASLLLVAATSGRAGSMTKLYPGDKPVNTLAYPGSGMVDVSMDVDPVSGAACMLVTPDAAVRCPGRKLSSVKV